MREYHRLIKEYSQEATNKGMLENFIGFAVLEALIHPDNNGVDCIQRAIEMVREEHLATLPQVTLA